MNLRDVLRPEHIVVPLRASTVKQATELLAARLVEAQAKTPSAQSGNQNKQTPYPTQLNLELHATPEDAKRILSSVDGLLNFSSEHSGLPVHSHVQGQLID